VLDANEHVLIIGADAAGLKTAARLRRLNPDLPITVLDRGEVISYAACGFPYYLSGDIDDFSELVQTAWGDEKNPEYFLASKGIEVLTGWNAVRIEREPNQVIALDGEGNQRAFPFTRLVLATGASPIIPKVPGTQCAGVHTFTRPDDVIELRKSLQRNEVGRVAVIGGGYIGLELCEAFAALWGVEVILIERENQVMPSSLDPAMASLVHDHLREQGVDVYLNTQLKRIQCQGDESVLTLNEDVERRVDRVIFAVGVRPNAQLALDAGLEIGSNGGIKVDNLGRTSDKDIYAAGDCTELPDQPGTRLLPLGSIANRMGRIVANTIAGKDDPGLPKLWGTGVVKVFDLNVASTGLSAQTAKNRGIDIEEYWGCFPDRAHYYPENANVKIKVVRERSGQLLGMQAIGTGEVVRWVDLFAQVLDLGDGDPKALMRFEHAYAPPYATAMDPLHHFGAMIETGDDWQVAPTVLANGGEVGWTWIDLLSEDERANLTIPEVRGKILTMSVAELRERFTELPKDNIVLLCARGPRSYEACGFLRNHGISARYLAGGMAFTH
jgi:NADPH-dependent 2,4-dienoyl-CoA reductase/sulfur reductase-like enzyme/rhodanese-related sulfurtransferase